MRYYLRIIKNFFLGCLCFPKKIIRKNRYSIFYCRISRSSVLNNCSIGDYSHIGDNCSLNRVDMGRYCAIANAVHIGGMEHSWWWPSISTWLSDECVWNNRTKIGNDVWIGASAIIRQGVTIGNGAVIGANSFVNKDVPPYAIVVGSPARILRYRFDDETRKKIEETKYWDYPPSLAKERINSIDISKNKE